MAEINKNISAGSVIGFANMSPEKKKAWSEKKSAVQTGVKRGPTKSTMERMVAA